MKASLQVLVLALILAGCDVLDDPKPIDKPESDGNHELVPLKRVGLHAGNLIVDVDSAGGIHELKISRNGQQLYTVYLADLWLAGRQGGTVRYSAAAWQGEWGNLFPDTKGVFYVTPDSLLKNISNWPSDRGAPVDAAGKPRLVGDAMAWVSLGSRPVRYTNWVGDLFNTPFDGLQVNQTVFAYEKGDLADMLFVRYEITNKSAEPMLDVYPGVYVDTDLDNSPEQTCWVFLGRNATAHYAPDGISYTYDVRYMRRQNPDNCPTIPVAGFTLVETPAQGLPEPAVGSHRIMHKASGNPDYYEKGFSSPQQAYNAVQGLTNRGTPMIDPTTGQASLFAFDGYPVGGTGWLDYEKGLDARTLLSGKAFNLAPGEKKVITVVFAYGEGYTLSKSIINLRGKISKAQLDSRPWQ